MRILIWAPSDMRITTDAGAGASGADDGLHIMLRKHMHKIGIETNRAKDPSDFIIGGRAKSLASAQNEHSRMWPTGLLAKLSTRIPPLDVCTVNCLQAAA